MTLLVCWLVFPLLLAAVCLGCGLAVERGCRTRIQPALLVPVGFSAAVVIGLFTTLFEQTARLTLPVLLTVAALGLVASLPGRLPRIDPWAVGSAVAVFAAFAAPIVLSGEATFAGYIKLDDTSTFLAILDRALEHGRSVDGLAPSSYQAALSFNLHFYPLGSLLPLGAGASLTGQDPAWLFQPYLAFLAALLALVLYQLASLVIASRPLRAVAAVLAAQAALLYGYALWGGVKEIAAALLVALVAALTGALFPSNRRVLAVIPLAIVGAALVGVLSIGAAAWLLPTLGLAGVALLRRGDGRRPSCSARSSPPSSSPRWLLRASSSARVSSGRCATRTSSGTSSRRSARSSWSASGRPVTSASVRRRSARRTRCWPSASPPQSSGSQ